MPVSSCQFETARKLNWQRLAGLQPYQPILEKMEATVAAIRRDGASEAVWLLEHSPIYTGGTSAKNEDLLATGPVPLSM